MWMGDDEEEEVELGRKKKKAAVVPGLPVEAPKAPNYGGIALHVATHVAAAFGIYMLFVNYAPLKYDPAHEIRKRP